MEGRQGKATLGCGFRLCRCSSRWQPASQPAYHMHIPASQFSAGRSAGNSLLPKKEGHRTSQASRGASGGGESRSLSTCTRTHTHTRSHTHTGTHTRTHARTHTKTQGQSPGCAAGEPVSPSPCVPSGFHDKNETDQAASSSIIRAN